MICIFFGGLYINKLALSLHLQMVSIYFLAVFYRENLLMKFLLASLKTPTILDTLHCKKSWRSSSTPTSGDAGPKHTGNEQIFPHPCRKFYYKYRTFPTFFTSVELVRRSWKDWKANAACGREPTTYWTTICHSTTAPRFLMQLELQ